MFHSCASLRAVVARASLTLPASWALAGKSARRFASSDTRDATPMQPPQRHGCGGGCQGCHLRQQQQPANGAAAGTSEPAQVVRELSTQYEKLFHQYRRTSVALDAAIGDLMKAKKKMRQARTIAHSLRVRLACVLENLGRAHSRLGEKDAHDTAMKRAQQVRMHCKAPS